MDLEQIDCDDQQILSWFLLSQMMSLGLVPELTASPLVTSQLLSH